MHANCFLLVPLMSLCVPANSSSISTMISNNNVSNMRIRYSVNNDNNSRKNSSLCPTNNIKDINDIKTLKHKI